MLYLLIALLTALAAYLAGSVSGAIIISKKVSGSDIRSEGSKNAGTTNMLRVHGKKAALMTLLIDVLKGVLAVLIGTAIDGALAEHYETLSVVLSGYQRILMGNMKYIAAVFVVLGHDFPIYFGFKGGKGVATSIGAAFMLDWRAGLIVLTAALIIMVTTRYVSLGSVAGAVAYPCIVAAFMLAEKDFNPAYILCAVVLGLLITVKHKTNIERLKNGTENKLFSKKGDKK